MNSADHPAKATDAADVGLLAPIWAGTPVADATGDGAFLQAMLDAEAALTGSQAMLGQAPEAAAAAVTAAARAEGFDLRGIAVRARAGGNPVIPLVADLTDAVPADAAAFVHRGATSQDILDTAIMLVATRTVAMLLDDLRRTVDALAQLAAEHRQTPMAGRTLTQHAVPTTFGLKVAGWRSLVLDSADRLTALRLPAQLGGAAGTLAAFEALAGASGGAVELTEAFAAELGLAVPELPWHVLRTPIADLAAALAVTVGALGKIAADVLVLSRTEIGEVAEGGAGVSSAMPHKANPVRATLIAAAARQAPALAAVLFGALSAEDERPAGAWHAEWQTLRELLRLAGGATDAAAGLVGGLRVFPARMLENLHRTRGLVVSERLAAELSGRLGRGPARRLLSAAVDRAGAEGLNLADVLADAPELKGLITRDRLDQLADPADYLGAAAELVDRALLRAADYAADRAASSVSIAEEPLVKPVPHVMNPVPHFVIDGAPGARPLVLGPSLGTSLAVWDSQVKALARDHRVIRWDLPGHGGSPASLVGEQTTVAGLADLVLALADHLGLDRFAYAGISIGGAVGAHLAVHHPERVGSLALICSSADFGDPQPWRERAAKVRSEGTGFLAASAADRWFTPAFPGGDAMAALISDQRAADPIAYAACCEALAVFDLRGELDQIAAPTLVVGGRQDVATPLSHARELADGIAGAGLVEIPGAGHLAPVECPRAVLAALRGHFSSAPSDDADHHDAGMAVRRTVLGDAHVDRAIAATTELTAGFQDFITRYAWGEIWTRPGLDRRTRSCITLTALVAGGHHEELAMHVRGAVRNGLTPAEIGEVLLQTAVYCGVPAANAAFAIAGRVLEEGVSTEDKDER